jgi:hypothetical protein
MGGGATVIRRIRRRGIAAIIRGRAGRTVAPNMPQTQPMTHFVGGRPPPIVNTGKRIGRGTPHRIVQKDHPVGIGGTAVGQTRQPR